MSPLLALCAALAPAQPEYPGDDAPVEELLRFYNDLQQYLNVVTQPLSRHSPYRDMLPIAMCSPWYGKRAGGRALGEEPLGTPGC